MNLIPRRRQDRGLRSFRSDMDRLFEDFLGGAGFLDRFWGEERAFTPAVDVKETDTHVVVEAELPGMDPKEIDVRLEGGALVLTGERKHEEENDTKGVHRVERYFGRFQRRIPLPDDINPEDVGATYQDGVLSVRVAKREDARPRSIPVTVTR